MFTGYKDKPTRATDKALMSAFDTMKEPASGRQSADDVTDKDTPHVKKRHRRMKSSGLKKDGDEGGDGLKYYVVVTAGYETPGPLPVR